MREGFTLPHFPCLCWLFIGSSGSALQRPPLQSACHHSKFRKSFLFHWRDDEAEGHVAERHAVFLQRQVAPAVGTAQALLREVDGELGELALRHLRRVALRLLHALVEVGNVVVERASVHPRADGLDVDAEALGVGLFPPADVALRATLLRTDVREVLLVGGEAVQADALGELSVAVVLYRSATVPLALVHVVRQVHHHAEAQQVRSLGVGRGLCHGLLHVDGAVAVDLVGECQLGLHVRHIVTCRDGRRRALALLYLLHGDGGERHIRVVPSLETVLQAGAHVVVGHGAPEVRLQRSALAKHALAVDSVLAEQAGSLVEGHGSLGGRDDDCWVVFLVLYLHLLGAEVLHVGHGRGLVERNLLVGHGLPLGYERLGGLGLEVDVEHHLTVAWNVERKRDVGGLLWRHVELVHAAALHALAVFQQ